MFQVIAQIVGAVALLGRERIARCDRIRIRRRRPAGIERAAQTVQLLFGIKHVAVAFSQVLLVVRPTHHDLAWRVVPADLAIAELGITPRSGCAVSIAGAGIGIATQDDARRPTPQRMQVGANPSATVSAQSPAVADLGGGPRIVIGEVAIEPRHPQHGQAEQAHRGRYHFNAFDVARDAVAISGWLLAQQHPCGGGGQADDAAIAAVKARAFEHQFAGRHPHAVGVDDHPASLVFDQGFDTPRVTGPGLGMQAQAVSVDAHARQHEDHVPFGIEIVVRPIIAQRVAQQHALAQARDESTRSDQHAGRRF